MTVVSLPPTDLLQESFGLVPLPQDFGYAPLIAAVPEPSTLVLALLMTLMMWDPRLPSVIQIR